MLGGMNFLDNISATVFETPGTLDYRELSFRVGPDRRSKTITLFRRKRRNRKTEVLRNGFSPFSSKVFRPSTSIFNFREI
jgi:hypothetical protein